VSPLRGLAHATDANTHLLTRPDPYAARFDMGDSPIAWARSRLELTDELLVDLPDWAVDPDEPTYYLRSVFNAILRQRYSGMPEVAKLASGKVFSRSRASDPDAGPPFRMIPRETREAAIAFLGRSVFASDSYPLEPELLNRLAPVRWKDWATARVNRLDWPVHDFVINAQPPPVGPARPGRARTRLRRPVQERSRGRVAAGRPPHPTFRHALAEARRPAARAGPADRQPSAEPAEPAT